MLHRLVINSPNFRKTVDLVQPFYSIGRQSSNSIVLPYSKISRRHATIFKKENSTEAEESYTIIDGDTAGNISRNGIFLKGRKIHEHELRHGDIINLADDITISYFIVSIESALKEGSEQVEITKTTGHSFNDESQATQIAEPVAREIANNEDLTKLASLVELSPNPIIEINLQGEITYLNSVANYKFKNLQKLKLEHPLLKDLLDSPHHKNGNLLIREVKVGTGVFEQHIHYLTEYNLIRIYVFDITERKLVEESLQYQAYYDTLTNLPNRALFNEKLSLAIANAQEKDCLVAVMFIDIDGFKNINEALGHTIGDQVLQSFAKRLRDKLRGSDFLARWGGDEFILLLPETESVAETEILAQRILENIRLPFELSGNTLYLQSSIGIAIYPQDGEDGETLIKNADAALHSMKESGRNSYQYYTATITSGASERLKIKNLLYEALEKEQLCLYYQPQINITTGKICGMEALLRWIHPEQGLISPAKFIPIAEESGLILSIGEWVLRKACVQNRMWQDRGLPAIRVAVNLSAQQFQQANLINLVQQVLEETGLAPYLLELEVTETTLMKNVDFALQVLQGLRQMGVHLSMDDFGTGYSSLGYLKQFPFHSIKIDQSFVRDLQDHPQDLAIISAVMAIGRGFNLRVIAEGVETEEQLKLLKDLNCEEMQGYKFSIPLSAEDATEFLLSHANLVDENPFV